MNFISPRFICGNRGGIASRYGILNTLQRGGALCFGCLRVPRGAFARSSPTLGFALWADV